MSDLDGVCLIKKDGKLTPADFRADEVLAAIGEGKEVIVSIRKPRSPAHHRRFFALMRKVCEQIPVEPQADETELLEDLKRRVGHVEHRKNLITGQMEERPKSIAFASMDQIEFTRFEQRCLYVIHVVFGIDPDELMQEVEETQRRVPAQQRDKKTKVIHA